NRFSSRDSVPDTILLWFHHVGWRERLRSGRTLWEELLRHYQAGVDTVRWMQRTWDGLEGLVDAERFRRVQGLLRIQEAEARCWRRAAAARPSAPVASRSPTGPASLGSRRSTRSITATAAGSARRIARPTAPCSAWSRRRSRRRIPRGWSSSATCPLDRRSRCT